MLVFLFGLGSYWEYDGIASFDGEDERGTIDKTPLIEVCCLFELPNKAD